MKERLLDLLKAMNSNEVWPKHVSLGMEFNNDPNYELGDPDEIKTLTLKIHTQIVIDSLDGSIGWKEIEIGLDNIPVGHA
jgi:hypothetical protein